ncbi:MAG: hypothetical protein RSE02_08700 [Bacteroidales bacterium]
MAQCLKISTTDSKHSNYIAENLLTRDFNVLEPNKFGVSNITYIRVKGGFDYLTIIIDLFDRKNEFIDLLNKYGVVRSNSRKGNCWDNTIKKLTMPLNFLCGLGLLVQEVIYRMVTRD